MYQYILLMSVFAIVPSVILLIILRDKINFKKLTISLFILFAIGVVWDQVAVKLGIWNFSDDKIIGRLFGIPVEEYIFVIFVPLLAITIYTLVDKINEK